MAKPKIKPRFTPPTTAQLLAQAAAHQVAQRYKDLIEVYKELLGREDRPEWRVALAHAYGQRARALATKGMYREAVAMWESSRIPETTESDASVVGWMLAAGMYSQATMLLREIPVLPVDIQTRVGIALLIGHDQLASGLPDDSPLLRHLDPARAALAAWCRGEDNVTREQLRAIPFRSPYRELRQVMQGLLAADQESLEAVPNTSPYAGITRAALAAHAPLADLERRITALRPVEQELAAVIRGVDPVQLRVIIDLRAALTGKEEDVAPLFRWVSSKPSPVPEEQARRFALSILPHQPYLLTIFQKRFTPLTPFENARLRALLAEREDDLERAQTYWKNTFDACDLKNATGALMGAMILRHQASLETKMYGPEGPNVARYLNQSLQLDPLDRATWLQSVKQQREDENPKWHSLAEQALTHLPADPDLLLLAAQGAAERSAYKKASGYVTTLLRLDPINIGARRLLIGLHLSHARKSLKSRKNAIAARELETVGKLVHGGIDAARLAVHQAFLAVAQGKVDTAREFAEQAASGPSGGMGATLLLCTEGEQAGLKPNQLGPLHAGFLDATPSATQVIALLELLEELFPLYTNLVSHTLNHILASPLKAAASYHDYTQEQLCRLLEILHKCLQWDVMVAYVATALERWPGRPIFVFYHYVGISHNQASRLAKRDRTVLEHASETAMDEDDDRTARMIDLFLGAFPFMRGFPRNRQFPTMPPDIQRMMDDMAEELGQPPESIHDLLTSFFDHMVDDADPGPRKPRGRGKPK